MADTIVDDNGEPLNAPTWRERHKGHDWSFNEEGCMTYGVTSVEENGAVHVDTVNAEGTVDKNYLFCETCYDKPDAVGPAVLDVVYE